MQRSLGCLIPTIALCLLAALGVYSSFFETPWQIKPGYYRRIQIPVRAITKFDPIKGGWEYVVKSDAGIVYRLNPRLWDGLYPDEEVAVRIAQSNLAYVWLDPRELAHPSRRSFDVRGMQSEQLYISPARGAKLQNRKLEELRVAAVVLSAMALFALWLFWWMWDPRLSGY